MEKNAELPNTLPKFVWRFIKPYKLSLCVFMAVAILWALELVIRPYMLKLLIDRVIQADAGANLSSLLFWPAAVFAGVTIIMNISFRITDYIALRLLPVVKSEIILATTAYLEGHSFAYFQSNFGGNLARKVLDLSLSVERMMKMMTSNIIPSVLILVFGLVALFFIHALFTAIFLVWLISFTFGSYYFIGRTKRLSMAYSSAISGFSGKLVDSISNIFSVMLFAREEHEIDILRNSLTSDVAKKDRAFQWNLLHKNIFQASTVNLLIICLLCALIYTRQHGEITAGDFALVITLSFAVSDAVWRMAHDLSELANDAGVAQQALALIVTPHHIVDAKDARQLVIKEPRIEFRNVLFSYKKTDPLFKNLSVTIKPGEKVGLVGFSGSGKTTFANLLTRMFDINDGEILIDGQNIASVSRASLREHISFIPQEPVLFHREQKENIRYGRLNASDDEVMAAAARAHAHEFILNSAQGYQTQVGERGNKLSGGQRQRIAIARAILKDAPILILDEATSALDSITEDHIQDSLNELMQNKTVLVIAHRLSTLMHMDRILVFNKGAIVEEGTHASLTAQNGLYASLWASQVGGFIQDRKLESTQSASLA